MKQPIFSGPSHVEIQGEQVLRFITVNEVVAIYELLGFEEYPVFIYDYRPFGLDAINTLLQDERYYDFAPRFNKPSDITITETEKGDVVVELRETNNQNPNYMLWIAIGIEETPPKYSYVIRELVPYEKQNFALFSVYKRPFRKNSLTFPFASLDHKQKVQILETSSLIS